MTTAEPGPGQVWPHPFYRRGWRFWICDWCYAPSSLHPRKGPVKRRPKTDNSIISSDAPHFREGW